MRQSHQSRHIRAIDREIVGGGGRDILTVTVGTAAGTYTMQAMPLSGWDAPSVNAWEHTGDFVVLGSQAGPTTSVTLNALNGASFMQFIGGGQGIGTGQPPLQIHIGASA